MAARRPPKGGTPEPEPMLRVPASQLDEEIRKRLEIGEELLTRQVQDLASADELRRDFYTWNDFNEQLLRSRFTTGKVADRYRMVGFAGGGRKTPQQELETTQGDTRRQSRKLESVRQQLGLYDSQSEEESVTPLTPGVGTSPASKVFIVHGHDADVKYQVLEFLEKTTGERPVVLHEQPDSGRTIIEKFEAIAAEAGFAVVLLTADDLGRAKDAVHRQSSRPSERRS